MKKIRLMFKQMFCWHAYKPEDTHGWYGEPKPGAVCIHCGKVNIW